MKILKKKEEIYEMYKICDISNLIYEDTKFRFRTKN